MLVREILFLLLTGMLNIYTSEELRGLSADLTLMIQADMLAYHAAGEPPQLGLPDL